MWVKRMKIAELTKLLDTTLKDETLCNLKSCIFKALPYPNPCRRSVFELETASQMHFLV